MTVTESDTGGHEVEDQQVARRMRQRLLSSQPQATDFDEIWRRAERQLQSKPQKQPLWRRLGAGKPSVWAVSAAALVLVGTIFLVQFETGRDSFENQQPLVSAIVTPDDELFKALIKSTHWIAPSDRFLKQPPQLNVWGLPALNIQSPGSS